MKILHVCPLYYPSVGGNQTHIQYLSEQMAQLGEDVHVFTANALTPQEYTQPPAGNPPLPTEETIGGVKVKRFKIHHAFQAFMHHKLFKIRGGYRLFKTFLGDSEIFWNGGPVVPRMLGAIWRLKPDIILASHNRFFTTYLCTWTKKLHGIPLVIMPITHVTDPWQNYPIQNILFDLSDAIIACTEFEKQLLVSRGVDEKKVRVLPLGIDPSALEGGDAAYARKKYHLPEGPIVAYLGRKVPQKGIEHLVDAMRIVWKEFPNCHLLLAGQHQEGFSAVLQRHIDQYSQQEKKKIIQVHDFPEEDKRHLYAVIDVFAMPSSVDCFGIVYLEAWANAKPVIACRHTPQETIISHNEDGLLVEYGNIPELAGAIGTLLRQPALRSHLGQKGKRNLAEKYLLKQYACKLLTVYKEICRC